MYRQARSTIGAKSTTLTGSGSPKSRCCVRENCSTAARHVTSGTLVAFTQLQAPHNRPETVEQMYTGVLDGHRGHGLGLLLKATNCDLICRERPTSRRIHTFNADENDHMLAINTLLGYRAEGICVAWQKKLADSVG